MEARAPPALDRDCILKMAHYFPYSYENRKQVVADRYEHDRYESAPRNSPAGRLARSYPDPSRLGTIHCAPFPYNLGDPPRLWHWHNKNAPPFAESFHNPSSSVTTHMSSAWNAHSSVILSKDDPGAAYSNGESRRAKRIRSKSRSTRTVEVKPMLPREAHTLNPIISNELGRIGYLCYRPPNLSSLEVLADDINTADRADSLQFSGLPLQDTKGSAMESKPMLEDAPILHFMPPQDAAAKYRSAPSQRLRMKGKESRFHTVIDSSNIAPNVDNHQRRLQPYTTSSSLLGKVSQPPVTSTTPYATQAALAQGTPTCAIDAIASRREMSARNGRPLTQPGWPILYPNQVVQLETMAATAVDAGSIGVKPKHHARPEVLFYGGPSYSTQEAISLEPGTNSIEAASFDKLLSNHPGQLVQTNGARPYSAQVHASNREKLVPLKLSLTQQYEEDLSGASVIAHRGAGENLVQRRLEQRLRMGRPNTRSTESLQQNVHREILFTKSKEDEATTRRLQERLHEISTKADAARDCGGKITKKQLTDAGWDKFMHQPTDAREVLKQGRRHLVQPEPECSYRLTAPQPVKRKWEN